MKTTIMMMLMMFGALRAGAALESVVSAVAMRDTNATSGLIETTMLIDYATAMPEKFLSSDYTTPKSDIIWRSKSQFNINAWADESDFAMYIGMDIQELSQYLSFNSNDVPAMTVLAVKLYQTNEVPRSLSVFERVRHINPYYERSAELYSAILIKSGDFSSAIRISRKILDHLPHNEIIRFNIACAYALKNEKNEALYQLAVLTDTEWGELIYHLTDPDLDNLRQEAPFKEMENHLQETAYERIRELTISTEIAPRL